ncbi:hypothetical protein [Luteimonas kalidii]|uniref:Uncharacterized protein n=1 Tax=Luteimonas kalidii TaxID=3042025 RepID=A0ABT6JRU6_9GAMM|nr:hypothetical protein [Luteimonas kalidii]MDH5833407.1 hypothetical protein [Luteimonas kalidii]
MAPIVRSLAMAIMLRWPRRGGYPAGMVQTFVTVVLVVISVVVLSLALAMLLASIWGQSLSSSARPRSKDSCACALQEIGSATFPSAPSHPPGAGGARPYYRSVPKGLSV